MRIVVRSLAVAVIGLASVVPAQAGPPLDLERLPIHYQADGPYVAAGYGMPGQGAGEWRVTGGSLGEDDRLTLELEIRPGPPSVALDPGPAVLFGVVSLSGDAGGDVGVNADVDRVVAQVLPACDPADCVHRASITLPTHVLPRLARAANARSWMAAEVSLSLVRTFAQGTWVSYLGFYDESREHAESGQLGRPEALVYVVPSWGATPVGMVRRSSRTSRRTLATVERLRRTVADPSRLPVTAPLLVDLGTSSCTQGYSVVTATGDTVLDERRTGRPRAVRVDVPVGTDWLVVVPSLTWSPAEESQVFGPFAIDGPTAFTGWVSGDGWDERCPAGGHVVSRSLAPPDPVGTAGTRRCAQVDGRSLPWPSGILGGCTR